jgi:hypothetical protein
MAPKFRGPYEVVPLTRNRGSGGPSSGVNVEIRDASGRRRVVHVSQLKPYVGVQRALADDLKARSSGPTSGSEEGDDDSEPEESEDPRPQSATPEAPKERSNEAVPATGGPTEGNEGGLKVVGSKFHDDTQWFAFASPDGSDFAGQLQTRGDRDPGTAHGRAAKPG